MNCVIFWSVTNNRPQDFDKIIISGGQLYLYLALEFRTSSALARMRLWKNNSFKTLEKRGETQSYRSCCSRDLELFSLKAVYHWSFRLPTLPAYRMYALRHTPSREHFSLKNEDRDQTIWNCIL